MFPTHWIFSRFSHTTLSTKVLCCHPVGPKEPCLSSEIYTIKKLEKGLWHPLGKTQLILKILNSSNQQAAAKVHRKKKWSWSSLLFLHTTHQLWDTKWLGILLWTLLQVFSFSRAKVHIKFFTFSGRTEFHTVFK